MSCGSTKHLLKKCPYSWGNMASLVGGRSEGDSWIIEGGVKSKGGVEVDEAVFLL